MFIGADGRLWKRFGDEFDPQSDLSQVQLNPKHRIINNLCLTVDGRIYSISLNKILDNDHIIISFVYCNHRRKVYAATSERKLISIDDNDVIEVVYDNIDYVVHLNNRQLTLIRDSTWIIVDIDRLIIINTIKNMPAANDIIVHHNKLIVTERSIIMCGYSNHAIESPTSLVDGIEICHYSDSTFLLLDNEGTLYSMDDYEYKLKKCNSRLLSRLNEECRWSGFYNNGNHHTTSLMYNQVGDCYDIDHEFKIIDVDTPREMVLGNLNMMKNSRSRLE